MSIIVEVNRSLYLDEATGKAGERFDHVQSMLARVLKDLAGLPMVLQTGPMAVSVAKPKGGSRLP
jgi:hypothetical protein